jgi:hypothetical protein
MRKVGLKKIVIGLVLVASIVAPSIMLQARRGGGRRHHRHRGHRRRYRHGYYYNGIGTGIAFGLMTGALMSDPGRNEARRAADLAFQARQEAAIIKSKQERERFYDLQRRFSLEQQIAIGERRVKILIFLVFILFLALISLGILAKKKRL